MANGRAWRYPEDFRRLAVERFKKCENIEWLDRWVLVLVDDVLPGMMEPSDVGALDLNLDHFRSVVIVNPDASLALEYPNGS
jgi:hypothetical protein